jgi:hypothetical protein
MPSVTCGLFFFRSTFNRFHRSTRGHNVDRMKDVWSALAQRGAAALVAAGVLVLAASCGSNEGPSSTTTSGSAIASITAAPTAPPPPSCPPGKHPDPAGVCVDDDAGAPAQTASASASAPRPPPSCPPITNPDKVVSFDWKELGVDAPLATRLRGVSGAAVEAQLLSAQIEAELRPACAGIAADLGSKGVYASAPVACQAAVDALKAARAKLGPAAKVGVRIHPAVCPTPISTVKDCAKRCNGDDQAPDATCAGATIGRCPGTCDGPCEMRQPGTCDGTCLGRCESGFNGTCGGTCKGTCNGKPMKEAGECKGTCEGSCDAVTKGACKGRCAGGCQLHASACAGACAGKCSVALEDPKCWGSVKLAGTGPECSAYCELRAVHRAACGPAQVDVRVDGAKDAKAKAAYTGAIERHLPAILKVEAMLRDHAVALGKSKTAVADGLKAITQSNSPSVPSLAPCLFGYDRASVEGTDKVLASYRAVGEVAAAAKAK